MAPSARRQPPPGPAAQVADRLHSAAIHILRGLRQADRASGLSGPRLSALSVIVFGGPIRMTELARAEQVQGPTMTLIVRGLSRAGLVELSEDPEDGRARRVRATAKGRMLLQAARERRVAQLARAVATKSDSDRRLLARAAELMEEMARLARTSGRSTRSTSPGRGR
jgi:DNA-binding MarR family transcriptional regulator